MSAGKGLVTVIFLTRASTPTASRSSLEPASPGRLELGGDDRAKGGPGRPVTRSSGRKRGSATAGLRRLRVHENEALLHQRLLVVEGHAVQINERLGIDKHPYVAELKNPITFPRLRVEADVVAEARTTAALDAKTQTAQLGRNALFDHRATDLGDGLVRHRDSLRGGGGRVFGRGWHTHRAANRELRGRSVPRVRSRRAAICYFASAATGVTLCCFFFQSPMAARIASSASTEQWILTGGSESSFTISVFLICRASSTVLPFTHSVASEDDAIAEPQPKVLNLASSMTLV